MTVSVDSFLPLVTRECPGVTNIAARDAIVQACRDMCKRTYIWKEDLDPMTAVASVAEYDLEPPEGAEVVDILSMYHNDIELTPKTMAQLNGDNPSWRTIDGEQARHWVQNSPTNILLYPFPDTTAIDSIKNIRAALKPVVGATTVGDILYNDYREAIAAGALSILLSLAKKPWTNRTRAAEFKEDFEYHVSEAKIRARKDYSRPELNMRKAHRRFGGP